MSAAVKMKDQEKKTTPIERRALMAYKSTLVPKVMKILEEGDAYSHSAAKKIADVLAEMIAFDDVMTKDNIQRKFNAKKIPREDVEIFANAFNQL